MKKFFIIFLTTILCFFTICFLLKKTDENKVVIKFSTWGSHSEINLLRPLLDEFENENPDVKIELLHIPQNYFQKLHLLFASNLAPDVIFINNYYAPKYIQAGLLEDLSMCFDKQNYFEKSYSGFSSNGKIYAVPRDVSNLVVYYNKELFKQNNVPYPSSNWTMDDFLKTAQLLTFDRNNDGLTDVWGVSFEKDIIYWLPFLFSNGASLLSDDAETIVIDNAKALDAIDFYSALVNKYKAAPSKADSASLTMAQLFLQERLAMQISGRWLVPKYRAEAKFDWDIAPFPSGTKGSVVNIDSSGYALAKSSKHKPEAIRFIEFISSKKSLETLSKSGLIVPARKDAAYSSDFLEKDKKPASSQFFLSSIETGKPTPVSPNYQAFADKLGVVLEPVFLGRKNAAEALTKDVVSGLNH